MGLLPINRVNELYKNPDWLRTKYVEEEYSRKEIGDMCGVNENTIRYFMIKYQISSRVGSKKITERHRTKMSERLRGQPTWNSGLSGKYEKWTRRGSEAPGYKGGISEKGNRGYRKILMPEHHSSDKNGYVFEHRLICEEVLGRPLLDEEVVHHRNSDRLDNSLENLFVFPSNSIHIRFHQAKRKKPNLLEEEFCDESGIEYCSLRKAALG